VRIKLKQELRILLAKRALFQAKHFPDVYIILSEPVLQNTLKIKKKFSKAKRQKLNRTVMKYYGATFIG